MREETEHHRDDGQYAGMPPGAVGDGQEETEPHARGDEDIPSRRHHREAGDDDEDNACSRIGVSPPGPRRASPRRLRRLGGMRHDRIRRSRPCGHANPARVKFLRSSPRAMTPPMKPRTTTAISNPMRTAGVRKASNPAE